MIFLRDNLLYNTLLISKAFYKVHSLTKKIYKILMANTYFTNIHYKGFLMIFLSYKIKSYQIS